jgi:hypothetical protein
MFFTDFKTHLMFELCLTSTFIYTIDMLLTDEEIQNLTLLEIEKLMQSSRRSLKEFPCIPYPKGYVLEQLGNRLIYDERNYDPTVLKQEFAELHASLTGNIRQSCYEKIK